MSQFCNADLRGKQKKTPRRVLEAAPRLNVVGIFCHRFHGLGFKIGIFSSLNLV
jgi:hypothetical protein